MTSPLSLPLEIQHQIIANVEGKKTILMFGLVCHDWLAECRKTTFATQIDITRDWSNRSGKSFLKLLKSPHSTIRRDMARIHISYTILGPEDLQKVVRCLIRDSAPIKEMSLYGEYYSWKEEHLDPLVELLGHALPSLKILTITVVRPKLLNRLLQMLSAAPNLVHLTLMGFSGVDGLGVLPEDIPPPPPSLKVLETNLVYGSLFRTWVFRAESVKKYVVLGGMSRLIVILEQCDPADKSCNVIGMHGWHDAFDYIDHTCTTEFFSSPRCARALTHLKVSMLLLDEERFDLDLTHAVNLQYLTFDMVAPMENVGQYGSWIAQCLETAHYALIVDYVMNVSCGEDAESCNMDKVDSDIESFVLQMLTSSRREVRLITVRATSYSPYHQLGWSFPRSKALANRLGNFIFWDDRMRFDQ